MWAGKITARLPLNMKNTALLLFAISSAAFVLNGCKEDTLDAQFSADKTSIKAFEAVRFSHQTIYSGNGRVYLEWEFQGGTPATSTAPNPTVTYKSPGKYTVSLRVKAGDDGLSDTEVRIDYITVGEPAYKVAYGGTLPTALKNVLQQSPDEVRFVRMALNSNGQGKYFVAGENSLPVLETWSTMEPVLYAHRYTLDPACYMNLGGDWVVTYEKRKYEFKSISLFVTTTMNEAAADGKDFLRLDIDSDGGYALLTNSGFRSNSTTTGILNQHDRYARGFAFGSNRHWAVIWERDYTTSANCPTTLKNTLQSLKAEGHEFVDIEIAENEAWVVVYR